MIKATLKKKSNVPTHAQPVDENAAELFADQLDAAAPTATSASVTVTADAAVLSSPETALTRVVDTGLQAPVDFGLIGDFDASDVSIPQMKIVQGAGPLAQRFNIGSVVYGDDALFTPIEAPVGKSVLKFVVASFQKQFREHLNPSEQAAEMMPRTVNTLREALALGGTTKYGPNGERPRWSPSAKMILLLEAPEGSNHPAFCYDVDGKAYAPALVYAASTAYREFAQPIINRSLLAGKSVETMWWTYNVGKVKSGAHNVFVPQAKMVPGPVSDNLRQLALKFRSFSGTSLAD